MDRKRWLWVGGGVVLVLFAGVAFTLKARIGQQLANAPAWLKSYQPAEGALNPIVEPVKPAWAQCCRPSPMIAPCDGYGAGRMSRRRYPDNLASDPDSLVHARVRANVDAGVGR